MREITVITNTAQSDYISETRCARGCHCGTDTVYPDQKNHKHKVKKDVAMHQMATQVASRNRGGVSERALETNSMRAKREYLEQNPKEARRYKEMEELDKITGNHRKAVKAVLKQRRSIPKNVLADIKLQFQKYLDRYKLPWIERWMPAGIDHMDQSIETFVAETNKLNSTIRKALQSTEDPKTEDLVESALSIGDQLSKRMQKFHDSWGHLVRKSARIKRVDY